MQLSFIHNFLTGVVLHW